MQRDHLEGHVHESSAAERLLDSPESTTVRNGPVLLDALRATADPDLILHGLVRRTSLKKITLEITGSSGTPKVAEYETYAS
ncbi:hypothetical protein [Streptomyces werraensis]|uniref:hypothetical protein n=1 Tax=Streptomyces werraensis TaxID=68284 RepID=UPI003F4DF878